MFLTVEELYEITKKLVEEGKGNCLVKKDGHDSYKIETESVKFYEKSQELHL